MSAKSKPKQTEQWQPAVVHPETQYVSLQRVAVPGGWLYCAAPGDYRAQLVFVPDPAAKPQP